MLRQSPHAAEVDLEALADLVDGVRGNRSAREPRPSHRYRGRVGCDGSSGRLAVSALIVRRDQLEVSLDGAGLMLLGMRLKHLADLIPVRAGHPVDGTPGDEY